MVLTTDREAMCTTTNNNFIMSGLGLLCVHRQALVVDISKGID